MTLFSEKWCKELKWKPFYICILRSDTARVLFMPERRHLSVPWPPWSVTRTPSARGRAMNPWPGSGGRKEIVQLGPGTSPLRLTVLNQTSVCRHHWSWDGDIASLANMCAITDQIESDIAPQETLLRHPASIRRPSVEKNSRQPNNEDFLAKFTYSQRQFVYAASAKWASFINSNKLR